MRRAPRSVMVVDDDPDAREIIRYALEREEPGCSVTEAANGEAALRCLRDVRPDVVVTDLVMPGTIHGIDVVDACRAQNIPVVVVTGHTALAPRRRDVRVVSKVGLLDGSRILPTPAPRQQGVSLVLLFGVLTLIAGLIALVADGGQEGQAHGAFLSSP